MEQNDREPGGKETRESKYSALRAVIGMLLFIPWLVLDVVLKKHDPSLGYAAGLFIGMVTAYLLSPRPPKYWVMLALAVLLAASHFLLGPSY